MRLAAPRPIEPGDPLAGFTCGQPPLEEWLLTQALRAERERTARTYVVFDTEPDRLAGYYCLSAYAVVRDSIGGGALARNAPDRVPAVLLGRLAVDSRHQGIGLGVSLLHDAVENAALVSRRIGARALVVDAIDAGAAAFYFRRGFRPFPSSPLKLFHRL